MWNCGYDLGQRQSLPRIEMTGREPGMPSSPVLAATSDGELEAVIARLEAEIEESRTS